MAYSVKWEPEGIYVAFDGHITIEDISIPKAQFHGNERFDNLKYSIWDFSNITGADFGVEDVMTLVALDLGASFTLPKHRLAIVTEHPVLWKLAEKFVQKSEESESPWTFLISPSLDEARKWVGN